MAFRTRMTAIRIERTARHEMHKHLLRIGSAIQNTKLGYVDRNDMTAFKP
jgi:hypothetical protein